VERIRSESNFRVSFGVSGPKGRAKDKDKYADNLVKIKSRPEQGKKGRVKTGARNTKSGDEVKSGARKLTQD